MPGTKRHYWGFVGLGGLVLVNVVLITLLFLPKEPISAQPDNTAASPSESSADATSSMSASPTPSSIRKPTAKNTAPADGVPMRRLLVVSSARQGWRATVGDCDTPGTIELSEDGGKRWRKVSNAGLSPVSSLNALYPNLLSAVGGGKDCQATFAISYTSGDYWQTRDHKLGASWYLTPKDRNEIRAPGNRAKLCDRDMVDLAPVDENNAAALCADGAVFSTQNAGATWGSVGRLKGAVALGSDAAGYVIASLGQECTGVALNSFSITAQTVKRKATRCAPVNGARAGEVDVARTENTLWVWGGTTVAVSNDAGNSW